MIQSEINQGIPIPQEFQTGQTPLMQQYATIKQQLQDALLFFQVGDFYELFHDDAKIAAGALGIALTTRGKHIDGTPIPLCGVPIHASDFYIARLVKAGFKVALCNQLEPAVAGRLVARGVTQVLTPGTLVSENLLDATRANYLLSFMPLVDSWGIIFGEILTSQLIATVMPANAFKLLEAEVSKFLPDEILIPSEATAKSFISYFKSLGFYTSIVHSSQEREQAQLWIEKQLDTASRKSIITYPALGGALCQIHTYLATTQQDALAQFQHISLYSPDQFLRLDAATQANLELFKNKRDGSRKNTLWEHIDNAITPIGTRQLKKWLGMPLLVPDMIYQRQEVIAYFLDNHAFKATIESLLRAIGDLERIVGRILLRRGQPNDFRGLLRALSPVLNLLHAINTNKNLPMLLSQLATGFENIEGLRNFLTIALEEDEAQGSLIKTGFDTELDRMREIIASNTRSIELFEKNEQESTGISSLKVRYNQVHGYAIEITKSNVELVPSGYMRIQTLAGKERYTTLELKRLEHEYLNAKEEIEKREQEIFERIKSHIIEHATLLRKIAQSIGNIDGLIGLALTAQRYSYTRPIINQEGICTIKEGKHPIIAAQSAHRYITNDVEITPACSLQIITGPNMGGKSTYLRQVALTTILMQIGAYVPATYANLTITDQLFTRVGAGDDVASGKSTFLVEMEEAAYICAHATSKSLIILDEVGRGTSTHDGMAIAQAILEYIKKHIGGLCLFATHYHELAQLAEQLPGVGALQASCAFTKNGITLLYKIIAGAAQASFGIEVARRAHLPKAVVDRAAALLDELESGQKGINRSVASQDLYKQLYVEKGMLTTSHQAIITDLKQLDLDAISPRQAFDLIQLWQSLLVKKINKEDVLDGK